MPRDSLSTQDILPLIHTVRRQRVILASDLAKLYGVETKRLNEQVRRNLERFPSDFMFQLTLKEVKAAVAHSRSQFATLKQGTNIKYLPNAFTEHGALMAAGILNSPKAVAISVFIVRAFIQQRELIAAHSAILERMADIDKTLLQHNAALRDLYQKLMPLLQPPSDPPRPKIGFREEPRYRYGTRKI